MKGLLNYINNMILEEGGHFPSPEDGIRYIKVCLNYLNDDDIKKLVDEVKTMVGHTNMLENSNIIRNNIASRIDKKKADFFRKSIENILNKNKDYVNLVNYYKKDNLLKIDDIFTENNIPQFISENVGISIDTVKKLYNLSGGGRPEMGKGEILLDLICEGILNNSKGDVSLRDGRIFEIKGDNASVIYEKTWNSSLKELQEVFHKNDTKRKRTSEKTINPEFVELLQDKTKIKANSFDEINKLWGAYIIWTYAHQEGFTDLIAGDFIFSKNYFWISNLQSSSVKQIYDSIKGINFLSFSWPPNPNSTNQRCNLSTQNNIK